jgi:peptide/nickel transport system substrate-binding protein
MPKQVQRALLLLAVLALLSVSLFGCSSQSAVNTGDTEPSASQTASAGSGESSESGSSVTVGIAQDLDSLDPHQSNTAGTREVLFNIYEGLMKASPDGGVVPAVASDYSISDDGLTYTFVLRDGVKFHNGKTVTVDDVVYSLQRCAGSENDGTPLISAFSNVADISAPDDSHVVVTLAEANLEFINSMSAFIIPEGSGADIASNPIGTGPFSFVSYTPQSELVVSKFDDYWGETAKVDQVTFQIITNTNTMILALKGGTLDMVIHLPNSYENEVAGDFTVLQDTMKLVQALYINNAVAPFDDVRVRQAMYYAINVDEIIDFVCGGAGVATGTSMYPAQTQYFMPELAETYQQNVELAKELLAEAGYPNGFEMTITVPSIYAQHVQTGEIIAEQLKAVGITAQVEEVSWENWYADVYKGRDFQTTVCGVSASDMTAREMLQRYTSDHKKNFINFSNEEYDQVVAQAVASLDLDEQISLYKRAETILNEQAASLWIQDMCELVVMKPELDGFTFYQTYVLDMSTVYYK